MDGGYRVQESSDTSYYSLCSSELTDWTLVWARKFRRNLYALKKTGQGYTPVIKEFIESLNGSPKNINPQVLVNHIKQLPASQRKHACKAFSIFYEYTVPREDLRKTAENIIKKIESRYLNIQSR